MPLKETGALWETRQSVFFAVSRMENAARAMAAATIHSDAPPLPNIVPRNSPAAPGETNTPSEEALPSLSSSTSTPPPTWNSALPTPEIAAAASGTAENAQPSATSAQPAAAIRALRLSLSASSPTGICSAKAQ